MNRVEVLTAVLAEHRSFGWDGESRRAWAGHVAAALDAALAAWEGEREVDVATAVEAVLQGWCKFPERHTDCLPARVRAALAGADGALHDAAVLRAAADEMPPSRVIFSGRSATFGDSAAEWLRERADRVEERG